MSNLARIGKYFVKVPVDPNLHGRFITGQPGMYSVSDLYETLPDHTDIYIGMICCDTIAATFYVQYRDGTMIGPGLYDAVVLQALDTWHTRPGAGIDPATPITHLSVQQVLEDVEAILAQAKKDIDARKTNEKQ